MKKDRIRVAIIWSVLMMMLSLTACANQTGDASYMGEIVKRIKSEQKGTEEQKEAEDQKEAEPNIHPSCIPVSAFIN